MGKGAFLHHQQMAVFIDSLKKVYANSKFTSKIVVTWSIFYNSKPSDKAILLTFVPKNYGLRTPLDRHFTNTVHAYGTVYLCYWAIPVNKDTPPWKNNIVFPPMTIIETT